MKYIEFVGLDAHKDPISVAVAAPDRGDPEAIGTISDRALAVTKLTRRLGEPETLMLRYEAGPCGYSLYRELSALDATCVVVAPSLVPQRAGDRAKTDRRDAVKMCRALRNGDPVPVWVPDEDQEALRDLVRASAREDAREDLRRKRQQLENSCCGWTSGRLHLVQSGTVRVGPSCSGLEAYHERAWNGAETAS